MYLSFDFLSIKMYQAAAVGGKFPHKGGNSVSSLLAFITMADSSN